MTGPHMIAAPAWDSASFVRASAAYAARARDAQLVAIITDGLAPYPGTVYVLDHRDDAIVVRVGGQGGPRLIIPVDRYAFPYPPTDDELALDVARRTRAAWHALEPLEVPDNIVRGDG